MEVPTELHAESKHKKIVLGFRIHMVIADVNITTPPPHTHLNMFDVIVVSGG